MNRLNVAAVTLLFAFFSRPSLSQSCGAIVTEYVTVQQGASTVAASSYAPSSTASAATPYATQQVKAVNTTTTYGPIAGPHINITSPANIAPCHDITLFYGTNATEDNSAVNVTLSMNHPSVVLEYIDSVSKVDCSDDSVAVTFRDDNSYNSALKQWTLDGNFVMVTNHLGDCDAEFERGFFLVDSLISSSGTKTITAKAAKQQLDSIAHIGEFTFMSLPGANISKRLTLNPSTSISSTEALPNNTVLLSEGFANITAEDASFTSKITFSGYMNYNFWTFSLKQLYFDLNTTFTADAHVTASVAAAFSTTASYTPTELSYSLVDVPGIVNLGPALTFSVGVGLDASAAVVATSDLGVHLQNGNIHVDLLHGDRSSASGWTPTYTCHADVSEKVEVDINPMASVAVELAFTLLGGLIDLSSGIKATPGFTNKFTISAEEEISGNGITLPSGQACDQGIALKSDFFFNVTAFATKWYTKTLYSVDVPLADECYTWA